MKTRLAPLALLASGLLVSLNPAAQPSDDASASGDSGEWEHPVTPWGDPDLQGKWPLHHLITTPQQRPEHFGERLRFTEEELAEQRAQVEARNSRYEEANSENRIAMGHWAEESDVPPQTSLIVDPPDGRFPEMTEKGKELSAEMGSSWTLDQWDHYTDFDGWDRCISRGMPSSMFPYQYNNGIEIVQAPGYVVINLEMIHEARIVPVDGRPPLDSAIKQYMGESRGHWEGNTLVVETTNFNGKLSMTNYGITGHPEGQHATSTELHIVERFERVSEDRINYEITVNDPVTQTRPWTAAFPWQRDPGYEFFEYACHEDNDTIRNYIETSRFERAQESGDTQ